MLKVGDKVKIKRQYDPGATSDSYLNGFTEFMLELYAGKIFTICGKKYYPIPKSRACLPDDGYDYYLEEDSGYTWRSSMFEIEHELNLPNLF